MCEVRSISSQAKNHVRRGRSFFFDSSRSSCLIVNSLSTRLSLSVSRLSVHNRRLYLFLSPHLSLQIPCTPRPPISSLPQNLGYRGKTKKAGQGKLLCRDTGINKSLFLFECFPQRNVPVVPRRRLLCNPLTETLWRCAQLELPQDDLSNTSRLPGPASCRREEEVEAEGAGHAVSLLVWRKRK